MDEFKALVNEAGYVPVGTVYIKRFTSRGLSEDKLDEIRKCLEENSGELVIFDVSLKPKHMYQIVKSLHVEVKDRLEVILEIFRLHSPSKEADLQIKLASLQYELARARERVMLARAGEQPALIMGPGQYEVDKYYLEIKRRIQNIKKKLEEERRKRDVHRRRRFKEGFKSISIVGYTCSGKTTLFNKLSNLDMKVGPEPFTTLSTKYALLRIGLWNVYLIDTIGFIRDLPPFMINAFYSTLEEIKFSDIVYLVLDVSEPISYIEEKLKTSLKILNELQFSGKVIVVGNKIDLINNREALKPISGLIASYELPHVYVSGVTGEGLRALIQMTHRILGRGIYVVVEIPYSNRSIYQVIDMLKKGGMGKFEYMNDKVLFRGIVRPDIYGRISVNGDVKVRPGEEYLGIETRT